MRSVKNLAWMVVVAVVAGAVGWAATSVGRAADAGAAPAAAAAGKGELYHVVSFKFRETSTKEQIKALEDAFAALPGKIPAIKSLKWGTNVSPERLNKGFTHCWVLTFASEKDRDDYLVHPDHKAFGKAVGAAGVADVFVIDFWGQEGGK